MLSKSTPFGISWLGSERLAKLRQARQPKFVPRGTGLLRRGFGRRAPRNVRQRQSEDEGRALSGAALHPHTSPVGFDDAPGDEQPQPDAALAVPAPIPLKNVRQIRFRDPPPLVDDLELDLAVKWARSHQDAAA